MKPHRTTGLLRTLVLTLALTGANSQADPLGTAFTYQGRLELNGQPPSDGIYTLQFSLYDAPAPGGTLVNGIRTAALWVANGLFTTDLDFGAAAFTGDARWLEIAVSTDNAQSFTTLLPRVRVAPTPNAIYASTAGSLPSRSIQAGHFATPADPSPGEVLGFNNNSLVWQTPGSGSGPWLTSGANTYFTGGNVGMGTATPTFPLHLNSSASGSAVLAALLQPGLGNGGFNQLYLGRTPSGNGSATLTFTYNATTPADSLLSLGLYNSSFTFNVRGNGNVGIGTMTPGSKLDVAGGGRFRGDLDVDGNLFMRSATSEDALGVFVVPDWAPPNQTAGAPRFIVRREGTVGIGTSSPEASLDVPGNWDAGRPALRLRGQKPSLVFAGDAASGNRSWLMHLGANGPGNLELFNRAGAGAWNPRLSIDDRFLRVQGAGNEQAYIGGDGTGNDIQVGSLNPTVTDIFMYNAANGMHMHTHVGVLTIHGGADLAEPFPMKEEAIEKGAVVVIDDDHPGQLKRSTRAYDTRVAGIVSGANGISPGISLKQEGALDQGQNVALTGRVYVRADASPAAIKPGDLLTTSDLPGHAMKVLDPAKAQGAILGKAMSSLNEGTGLVLVLVTLQ